MSWHVDLEGLKQRQPRFKRKKGKGTFTAVGPNRVVSLDGPDKLIFRWLYLGCIDTASQKILFLRVWTSNSNPNFVGRWYFEYLHKSKILPNYVRIDKGTETATLSTMHANGCANRRWGLQTCDIWSFNVKLQRDSLNTDFYWTTYLIEQSFSI